MTEHASVAADLLSQLREHIPQALKELEEERDRIDTQLRTLRRLGKDIEPQSASTPPAPARVASKKTGRQISPATLLRVAETCATQTDSFTAHDIIAKTGINEPGVYVALKELRNREFLAKAGETQGKGVTPRALYRVLDRHVLDQLRGNNGTEGPHQP